MADTQRTMINIDRDLHNQMKDLSRATGIPIATFGKFLVDTGRPIIQTMADAIQIRNDHTVDKLKALDSLISELITEGQELTYAKIDREEHQHELENLDNKSG
jgi:hypothetical protein